MNAVTGTVIAERYVLTNRIGAGGMGAVWRATHITLGHDVAIKFLKMSENSDGARARFEREAKLAARLGEASRHIARVIDYGVHREALPYLVMELLQGETLGARARRERTLPLDLTAKLTVQLCRALQVAHAAGVIHRDLKPSNIFLASTEFDDVIVKLLDFGVAKSTQETDEDETTCAGTLIGTPGYMSPEQILCKRLDARTDLWAVGAVVYRLATGRSPFGQGGVAELGLRILATDPPRPSAVDPRLPRALDEWMEKALAKSAEERFQSARDLGDALSLIAGIRELDIAPSGPLPLLIDDDPARVSFPSIRISEVRTQREGPQKPRRALPLVPILAAFGILSTGIAIEHARASASAVVPRAPLVIESIAPPRPAASAVPAPVVVAAPQPGPSPIVLVKKPRQIPVRATTWTRKDDL
jgi:eukaryotic-like serine/threonine-protein kinase